MPSSKCRYSNERLARQTKDKLPLLAPLREDQTLFERLLLAVRSLSSDKLLTGAC